MSERLFFGYAQVNDGTWYGITGQVALHLKGWFVAAPDRETADAHSQRFFASLDASASEVWSTITATTIERGCLVELTDPAERLAWIQRVENGRFTQDEDGNWFLQIDETDLDAFDDAVWEARHFRLFEIDAATGFRAEEIEAARLRIEALAGARP